MKVSYLVLAVVFAATATGAFAETGVKITRIDDVANVYGRADVPNVRIAGPVVTRPSETVRAGSTTEPGPTAVAVGTGSADVNNVLGRS